MAPSFLSRPLRSSFLSRTCLFEALLGLVVREISESSQSNLGTSAQTPPLNAILNVRMTQFTKNDLSGDDED